MHVDLLINHVCVRDDDPPVDIAMPATPEPSASRRTGT